MFGDAGGSEVLIVVQMMTTSGRSETIEQGTVHNGLTSSAGRIVMALTMSCLSAWVSRLGGGTSGLTLLGGHHVYMRLKVQSCVRENQSFRSPRYAVVQMPHCSFRHPSYCVLSFHSHSCMRNTILSVLLVVAHH